MGFTWVCVDGSTKRKKERKEVYVGFNLGYGYNLQSRTFGYAPNRSMRREDIGLDKYSVKNP